MAFLCPVRIRRTKKKGETGPPPNVLSGSSSPDTSGGGRITGSSSIETLVRVGLEKETGTSARMTVLHDFSPCVDDELSVAHGDIVSLLYREHDWAYVIDSKIPPSEGFIPFSYITPFKPQPNTQLTNHQSHFNKSPSDSLYLSLYNFIARDENDLSLDRGVIVTVLNNEDPDWYWVIKSNGLEGFVPSAFLHQMNSTQTSSTSNNTTTLKTNQTSKTVELVMLYDYNAQAADDLSVKRGDWIHADLSVQTVQGWLWAFAPKQRKYGFIPRAYARLPTMTSL